MGKDSASSTCSADSHSEEAVYLLEQPSAPRPTSFAPVLPSLAVTSSTSTSHRRVAPSPLSPTPKHQQLQHKRQCQAMTSLHGLARTRMAASSSASRAPSEIPSARTASSNLRRAATTLSFPLRALGLIAP